MFSRYNATSSIWHFDTPNTLKINLGHHLWPFFGAKSDCGILMMQLLLNIYLFIDMILISGCCTSLTFVYRHHKGGIYIPPTFGMGQWSIIIYNISNKSTQHDHYILSYICQKWSYLGNLQGTGRNNRKKVFCFIQNRQTSDIFKLGVNIICSNLQCMNKLECLYGSIIKSVLLHSMEGKSCSQIFPLRLCNLECLDQLVGRQGQVSWSSLS